jgi:branched-chain amino acid aminotransferase
MSMHRFILHNGKIKDGGEAGLFAGQLGLLAGWGVFTTLRVADGALFAWERHWARMSRDAALLNIAMPADRDQVEQGLLRLVERNQAPDSTARLVVVRNGPGFWAGSSSGHASDVIGLTADSKSWPESVRLGIQPHGRHAASDFTRTKVLSWAHNLRWAERAQEQGLDEVILLNEFGRATECTSANLFAVFGTEVVTPPVEEGCLPGITREVLVDEVRITGLNIVERPLTLDELYRADSVFITSTTRGLLPVREIAGRELKQSGNALEHLAAAFNSFLTADIARRKTMAHA